MKKNIFGVGVIKIFLLLIFISFRLYATNINNGIECSEIMYDHPVSDAGGEWVEFYNDTGGSIDLTGWQFYDGSFKTLAQVQGWGDITSIPDKTYFVICESASTVSFTNEYNYMKSSNHYLAVSSGALSLGNTGELIVLKNASDVTQQSFIYPDNAVNASMRKVDINSNEDLSASWAQSDDISGSPFYSGRVCFITNIPSNDFVTKTNNHSIKFTLKSSLPADGKIKVGYPSEFDLSAVSGVSSFALDGSFLTSVSSSTVTITRSGGTVASAGSYNITISNVINASTPGDYRITMFTADSSDTLIDGPDINKKAFSLTPLTLSEITLNSSVTRKNVAGVTNFISFRTYHNLPVDAKIIITYPTGYDVTGVNFVDSSTIDGNFTITKSVTTVTLTRSGGTVQTGGEYESITLSSLNNPPTGNYFIQITTESNNGSVIDTTASSSLYRIAWNKGDVVINEVVTDPQVDWSTTGFDGNDGASATNTADEWLELFIKNNNINLSNGWIKCIDISPFEGDLNNNLSQSAFDFSVYSGNGNFASASNGAFLVLGNPDGAAANNNDVRIELYDGNPAVAANLIDVVTIGQYDDGNISDNAPDGGVSDGNASSPADEVIARIPNGIDTDNDANDFMKKSATIGKNNDNSSISLNNSYYIGFVTFATVTLIEPSLNASTTNCIITNISYANSRLKVTLYSNGKNSYGYTIYKGSFGFTNNALSGNNKLGVTNSKTNYFKAKYYDLSEGELKETSTSFWIATTPAGFTPGDIVINEFQTTSSDPVSDAIELYNKTGSVISLNGWKLKDIAGNVGYSFSTETINSNGYLILKGLSSEWNNSADAIVLENSYGTIIDKIYYSDAPAAGSTFARIPNGTWSGTNVSSDFQVDTTPTLGWNNDSTANLGTIKADKLFYFTTSSTCYITLNDGDNPANPVIVVITNLSLGSTNSFKVTLASNGSGIYTGYFRFSTNLLNTNSKIMYVTNGNSIQILYTDSEPSGIQSYKNIKWYKNIPPAIKISEVDVRGRWAGDTQKEFVELYNATGTTVNLTNWKIVKAGGTTLITLTGKIQPYGFYLCGETSITDINGLSPDQTWAAGYKLTDSDFGIQLLTADGSYVDSVGWGNTTGIDDGYYEGTPLSDIGSSETVTYERKVSSNSTASSLAPPAGGEASSGNAFDSDDNSADLVKQSSMNPQSSKSPQEPPAHSVVITKNRDITTNIYRGYTNIIVLSFKYTDGLDTILKQIKVQNIGNASTNDIYNVRLWTDINSDYALDTGDKLINSLNWNNSDSWTNNNLTLSSGTTNTNGNYLITISIKSNPTFGHTFIASIPVGGVKCEYGVYNTTGIYNNGYILIDSRPPAIGTNLVLTKSSVSNNNTSTFSFWSSITNKGDGVKYKIEWYGYENNPNYPSYIFDATNGNIYTNLTATVPKSVTPTNYILVLKVYDSQMYKSNYVTTLPSVLTVEGFFPPNIKEFSADKTTIILNGDINLRTINFTTVATDKDTSLVNLTSFITNLNVIDGPSITNMNYSGDGVWKYIYSVPSTTSPGVYSIVTKVTDNTGYYKLKVFQLTLKSNSAPIANAGSDQTVKGRTKVVLDGANSVDPDGDSLSYKWEVVTSSESININNNSAVKADFIAPNITGAVIVKLTVADIYGFSSSDTVTININRSFRADLTDAHPYNTVIPPDKNSVKFVNLSEGTVITIYTITGNKVVAINATEDEAEWQIPNYIAAGVYIVYMKDNAEHTKKMKIVIVR